MWLLGFMSGVRSRVLHEPLMNVHEISFFMRHTVISRKEDKMCQTFHKYRGISYFFVNFRTSGVYSDLNFKSLVGN